jgi:two-component system phosphate regulon sensor histidine kinase PhoR
MKRIYPVAQLVGEHLIISLAAALIPSALASFCVQVLYMALRYSRGRVHQNLDLIRLIAGAPLMMALPLLLARGEQPILRLLLLYAVSLISLGTKYWRPLLKRRDQQMTKEAYDRMLATLAHEIRTPLTIMQTTQNVLISQVPGPLNPRQLKFMESIYINTQRLITFSENMLSLIKLQQEWKPNLSSTIDLRALVKQVVEAMQPMIDLKRQQIQYSFPALLSRPKADETWIHQVLVNLVHNASKHTDEGGLILITTTQDDEQVVVTVTDNGQGLIGSSRTTLFEEFYQENQQGAYQDGYGLGLSIVRTIIERHGGHVYITSSKELGTMVSFTLPAEAHQ